MEEEREGKGSDHDAAVHDAKDERRKAKVKKELEDMVWEVYRELDRVAENKMELLNNVDLIKDELYKFPSLFLPKLGAFVRPDECFTGLTSSVDGVMYAVEGRLEGFPHLLKDLQVRKRVLKRVLIRRLKAPIHTKRDCQSPWPCGSCVRRARASNQTHELTTVTNQLRATPSRLQLVQMLKKLLCREASPRTAEACVALLQVSTSSLDCDPNPKP